MITIERDVTDINAGIICHVTNCMGAFNAGVARSIRHKFPVVYQEYYRTYSRFGVLPLGYIIPVRLTTNLWVVNMLAQYNYGNEPGVCYLDYDALEQCLQQIELFKISRLYYKRVMPLITTSLYSESSAIIDDTLNKLTVYFPDNVGCGNAGGDWTKVQPLLAKYFPDGKLCKLPTNPQTEPEQPKKKTLDSDVYKQLLYRHELSEIQSSRPFIRHDNNLTF